MSDNQLDLGAVQELKLSFNTVAILLVNSGKTTQRPNRFQISIHRILNH